MNHARDTHLFFEKFHQQFSPKKSWSELKSKARLQARTTEVEFMCVSDGEGQMLGQMVSYLAAGKPQKWVEVGALTGFSALCMMESLPVGSELWTCELNAQRSEFLRNIFASPEIAGRIHLIEGDSKASLEKISSCGPFDGIFIDGAKSDYEINLEWAEKNIRTGGSILADNIFLGGDLFAEPNKRNQAMKRFIERLLDPSKFRSVLLPNTDGLWLAQLIGK